jgi:predicted MFS family arabinose efflux permease
VLAGIGVCISFSFSILLPVAPVLAERSGPHGAAGAATAALFVGAVVGELLTPWLMTWWRSSRLLISGQVLTAIASLAFALPHPAVWQVIAAAGLRGIGMGFAIVVCVVMVFELSPPHRRGSAIGVFGFALSVPGVLLPSVGVWLMAAGRVDVAAVLAALGGLGGALLAARLPRRDISGAGVATNLIGALRQPGLLTLFVAFVLVSSSFGGIVTYAPVALPAAGLGSSAAFLLVAGFARAVSRWLSGVVGDRQSARLVFVAGIVASLVGLVALAIHGGPAAVLIAGAVYGLGFGTVQTAAYLVLVGRSAAAYTTAVSALWNSGIDMGASLGGVFLGLAAAQLGYAAAIWVIPAAVLVSLLVALLPLKRVAVPAADADVQTLPQTSSATPR